MKGSIAPPRPKKKSKPQQQRTFTRAWWQRLPLRQRQSIMRIGVWIFLVLFILSVAGGLFLAGVSGQTQPNPGSSARPTSTAPSR
ncbi:MAG: hypothetical protein M3Z37_02960 [Candidatus Eremiobacteraeota bacterium]|nr:hypothetical protein [Candidatus Eremiobacteraeota bacterium]